MIEDFKHVIESLLFVSNTPLTVQRIKDILNLNGTDVIRDSLEMLHEEYEARKGGFYLTQVAGGYQLRTRPEYRDWIQLMLQTSPARLSKAALETLAIIAYKQPVIRNDIEHIRGVDCGGVLRVLMERKMVRVVGRKEIPGRPMIYGTTREFLEMFGLKNLKDLPTLKEIEAFGKAGLEDTYGPGAAGEPDPPEDIAEPESADMPVEEAPADETNVAESDEVLNDPDTNDPPEENDISESMEEPAGDAFADEPEPPSETGEPDEDDPDDIPDGKTDFLPDPDEKNT